MPIYPLELINLQSDQALIANSIARWKFCGTGEWTGWSYGWGAAIAAHTAQPELARTLLLDYVDHFVSSSGMHMDGVRNKSYMTIWSEHNVLTLEAGFGAANAVQEMLLQSQDGSLRLFPAAPWPSAAFASLRGEGAFLVSARKNAGRLEFARITSLLGGPCRVLLPDDGHGLTMSSAGRPKSASWQERFLRFDTSPGETVVLSLPHVSEQIEPLRPVQSQCHFFGKKSVGPASWLGPGDDGKNP
jgi:alpha-L-fucosidase 2